MKLRSPDNEDELMIWDESQDLCPHKGMLPGQELR